MKMPPKFSIEIDKIVEFVGIQKDHRSRQGASSYQAKCPFCDDPKFHLNINVNKNAYSCVRCGQAGGALDLYGRLVHNTPLIPGKKKAGGNGDVLFSNLCKDLYGPNAKPIVREEKQSMVPTGIYRTADKIVHLAYQGILSFPHFRLSENHRENLKKRGLDDCTIERNEYRTIPEDMSWVFQYPALIEEFAKNRFEQKCRKLPLLEKTKLEALQAGFIVGKHLQENNVSMKGVPGFFRIDDQWFFKLETGMLIPTRNPVGDIVAIQARKDSGDIRYKTISAKDLPDGVTEGISRTHFPLGNVPASPMTKVYLTEGPLKADVASHLIGEESIFLAIQGVNNTKDFPNIFNWLKKMGVSTIYNALDMDKLTNPNVAKASRKIRGMAKEYGLSMQVFAWDEDCAWRMYLRLLPLCQWNNLKFEHTGNIFLDVGNAAEVLHKHNIKYYMKHNLDGTEEKFYWDDRSKGIDDWLYSQKKGE